MPVAQTKALEFIQKSIEAGVDPEDIKAMLKQRGGVSTQPTVEGGPATIEPRKPGLLDKFVAPETQTRLFNFLTGEKLGSAFPYSAPELAANVAEIGLPVAAVGLTKGMLPGAAALVQAESAYLGSQVGTSLRGGQPEISTGAPTALLAGGTTLAAGKTGMRLMRAGGVSESTSQEVFRRGVVGGGRLAFERLPVEAEAEVLGDIKNVLSRGPSGRQPITRPRLAINRLLARAENAGVRIPVRDAAETLVNAFGGDRAITISETGAIEITDFAPEPLGRQYLSAQRNIDFLAKQLIKQSGGIEGSLSPTEFERFLRREISNVAQKKVTTETPSHDAAYIQGLKNVKGKIVDQLDIAIADKPKTLRMLRARAQADKTAMENLQRRFFERSKGTGELQLKEGSISTARMIFQQAEQGNPYLLKLFIDFRNSTGVDAVPILKEIAMSRELNPIKGLPAADLKTLDGAIRAIAGLRSGAAELGRAFALPIGKGATVSARVLGAVPPAVRHFFLSETGGRAPSREPRFPTREEVSASRMKRQEAHKLKMEAIRRNRANAGSL